MADEKLPQFAADVMLGSLARWLRILGFDTWYSNKAGDNQLLEVIWREDRILLSRDGELVNGVRPDQRLMITSKKLPDQLGQVVKAFQLADKIRLFSLCSRCNVAVVPVEKDKIETLVPRFVFKKYNQFQMCPLCGQLFWPGTHKDMAIDWLAKHSIAFLEKDEQ